MSSQDQTSLFPTNAQEFRALEAQKSHIWKSVHSLYPNVVQDPKQGIFYKMDAMGFIPVRDAGSYEEKRKNVLMAHSLCKPLGIIAPERFSVFIENKLSDAPGQDDHQDVYMYTITSGVKGRVVEDFLLDETLDADFRKAIASKAYFERLKVSLWLGDPDRTNRNMLVTCNKDKVEFGHIDFGMVAQDHDIEGFFLNVTHCPERQRMLDKLEEFKAEWMLYKSVVPSDVYYGTLGRFQQAKGYVSSSVKFTDSPINPSQDQCLP